MATTVGGQGPERPDDDKINAETGAIAARIVETRAEEHRFGDGPRLIREFAATAGSAAEIGELINGTGVAYGTSHPDYPEAYCLDISYDENTEDEDRAGLPITVYSATLKATYSKPEADFEPNPLSRPDSWTFQSQGAPIAAMFYFDGETQKPLTNSAKDPIKGLQVDEAMQKIVIKGNRPTFPSAIAAAITNCVNQDAFLGFAAHHVKCQGITGELKYEVVNDVQVRYWEVTVELLARQTGWNLLIPDIGYNFIDGGKKKRCKVWAPNPDPETNELIKEIQVACVDPVALNGSGGQSEAGAPSILNRRVYREIPFQPFFGTPPA